MNGRVGNAQVYHTVVYLKYNSRVVFMILIQDEDVETRQRHFM
jgi:hypothetical protein